MESPQGETRREVWVSIDEAVAAIEANDADAMNGRIGRQAYEARRTELEALYQRALSEICVRVAKARARELWGPPQVRAL
jgi:hypothetical protein